MKRTLTDVQIEIFRHSEVQRALLKRIREVEAEAEAEEQAEGDVDRAERAIRVVDQSNDDEEEDEEEGQVDGPIEDVDEDEQYARFLEEEKKQFAIDAEKKRAQIREKQLLQQSNVNDRNVSTRRKVRELDEGMEQEDVVLDY